DLEQEFDMTFEVENLDQIVTIGDAADAIDEA
ncbi:MAG: acyl carrier protein, partial [Lancefieldella rimae]|nr:acyl carrier protein [Lancefieldella rimae]